MKKGLLLFVCAIAITTFTQAQVRFGFKAGVNFANLTGDDADGDMKIGFNAGAVAKISVSEAFSIQPELVLSTQGSKSTFEFEDEVYDVKMNLTYINVPVLAQYNAGGFIVETGPQFGFKVSGKMKVDGLGEEDIEGLKGFDLSWAVGAGYVTQSGFGFNARFNLGLTSIAEGEGKVKNSVIQAGVFYLLGGGGSAKK